MENRVLVTGANGFIGKMLISKLSEDQRYSLRAVVRDKTLAQFGRGIEVVSIPDINKETNWTEALKACDTIIHTAARVHVMKDNAADPLGEFRQVNVDGTLNLAKQALSAGVKRFIFLSSIKVNGEETAPKAPFQADFAPTPQDPYAISKYEAESQLLALGQIYGMEIVIIRPPLVYGPGVKGNFERMISWLKRGYPLPLGSINNKRSFVSVINLVDLIIHCIDHPKAVNQIFLVSDGEDISTTQLLKKLADSMDSSAKLLPVPKWMLTGMGNILGKRDMMQRLCSSLQVDISKTCTLLDWKPIVNIEDALAQTAQHYMDSVD